MQDSNIEFCDDPQEKIKEEIKLKTDEPDNQGSSSEGEKRLSQILGGYEMVFKLRLGSRGPEEAPPMKINLDPSGGP